MKLEDLTETQLKTYEAIISLFNEYKTFPTVADVAGKVGVMKNATHETFAILVRKGWLSQRIVGRTTRYTLTQYDVTLTKINPKES